MKPTTLNNLGYKMRPCLKQTKKMNKQKKKKGLTLNCNPVSP